MNKMALTLAFALVRSPSHLQVSQCRNWQGNDPDDQGIALDFLGQGCVWWRCGRLWPWRSAAARIDNNAEIFCLRAGGHDRHTGGGRSAAAKTLEGGRRVFYEAPTDVHVVSRNASIEEARKAASFSTSRTSGRLPPSVLESHDHKMISV